MDNSGEIEVLRWRDKDGSSRGLVLHCWLDFGHIDLSIGPPGGSVRVEFITGAQGTSYLLASFLT